MTTIPTQNPFKINDRVVCLMEEEYPSIELQRMDEEIIKKMGVGTVVGVPYEMSHYNWATAIDTVWVQWQCYNEPKWVKVREIKKVD